MGNHAKGRLVIAAIVLSAPVPILAQSSASYRLDEHVLNAGGRPAQAVVSASASFRLTLDSIGEPIAARALSGASFRMDGGFTPAYQPPGEVAGVRFLEDAMTLTWSWEPASADYNLYTGALPGLPGGYGTCALSQVAGNSLVDTSAPGPGSARFFLVTGENRLREEGTKGWASTGAERGNPSPCP